jgi:hypothetical protein
VVALRACRDCCFRSLFARVEAAPEQGTSAGLFGFSDEACEVGPCSRNARADGSNGAAVNDGSFVVGVPEQLGEDEGVALVVGELVEKEFGVDLGVVVGVVTSCELGAACALSMSDRVGAGTSCDGDQPGLSGVVAAESVKPTERSQIGVLDEVIDVVSVAEVVAEACDVADGQLDKTFERCRVAVLCGEEFVSGVKHGGGRRRCAVRFFESDGTLWVDGMTVRA